jgi:NAD(P)-dependent dehydrogenase (short-subunit alcohol dehydrogenase family)
MTLIGRKYWPFSGTNPTLQDCILLIGDDDDHWVAAFAQAHPLPLYHVSAQPMLAQPTHTVLSVNRNDPASIQTVLQHIHHQGHRPSVLVFKPPAPTACSTLSYSATALTAQWQQTGLSLFLWSQAVIAQAHPTLDQPLSLVVVGSALAQYPTAPYSASAALYAGMRGLSQSLAREFQPKGIHVVHLGLADQPDPIALAQICVHLHHQPHSAWTQALDSITPSAHSPSFRYTP